MNGEAELTNLKLKQVLDVLRRLLDNIRALNGPNPSIITQSEVDAEWHLKHVEPKWSET